MWTRTKWEAKLFLLVGNIVEHFGAFSFGMLVYFCFHTVIYLL